MVYHKWKQKETIWDRPFVSYPSIGPHIIWLLENAIT